MIQMLRFEERAADLLAQPDFASRWAVLTRNFAEYGMDFMVYALFSDDSVGSNGFVGSTFSEDFLSWYDDCDYAADDGLMRHVVCGARDTLDYQVGAQVFSRHDLISDADAIGFRGGIVAPFAIARADGGVTAGMNIGSSLSAGERSKVIAERRNEMLLLANLFHAASVGEALRMHEGIPRLSSRERDCLHWTAQGERVSAIAYKLKITEATVTLHLRNARHKLKARTLPHAVARALYFDLLKN